MLYFEVLELETVINLLVREIDNKYLSHCRVFQLMWTPVAPRKLPPGPHLSSPGCPLFPEQHSHAILDQLPRNIFFSIMFF